MPNQRAENMRHTSVTMPDELIRKLDAIAQREERSRNKVIQMILERQVVKYLNAEGGLIAEDLHGRSDALPRSGNAEDADDKIA